MANGQRQTTSPSDANPRGILRRIYQRYLVQAMGSLANGLFGSLIIGVILNQLAKVQWLAFIQPYADLAQSAQVIGAAVGVSIAYGMQVKPLAMFSSAVCGAAGYLSGGPIVCYLAAIAGAEAGHWISGRTKVDIILVPLFTIIAGGLVGTYTGPYVMRMMDALQRFIGWATLLQPIPMGILVATAVGLALTGPISSAALCFALFTPASGQALSPGLLLAAGAATAGGCAHMIGFAVASFGENRWGGLLSQGLGTSKIQLGNVLKRPAILLPAMLAAAVTGPLSTTVFQMHNAGAAAGMGTSGLVGQFGTWAVMSATVSPAVLLMKIVALHIVLPAIIAWGAGAWLRKRGVIRTGDMRLEL